MAQGLAHTVNSLAPETLRRLRHGCKLQQHFNS